MSIDRRIIYLSVGFLALYLPTYFTLSQRVWVDSEEMHGPILLAMAAWALWKERRRLTDSFDAGSYLWLPALALGLICFGLGRTLDILVLEVGSQVIVLLACLLLLGGWGALRVAAFPIAFLIFTVPLPGNLVDSLTGSLKQVVSSAAEGLLYWAGYPVARSGVVISVGPYQMLVADACSGLKSMFSLSALGILYIYLVENKSGIRNGLLLASLLPIAFAANVVRVIILILVTYHFGDAAGQGFIHDAAGIVLFVIALLILSGFDALLGFRKNLEKR